jgi:hypothetical protein
MQLLECCVFIFLLFWVYKPGKLYMSLSKPDLSPILFLPRDRAEGIAVELSYNQFSSQLCVDLRQIYQQSQRNSEK